MALTRKMLKAMGLEEDKIDQIIEAHSETVEALKGYKEDAEKLPDIQKKLEEANIALTNAGKDSWKVKYDALKEDYDTFKTEQTKKETRGAKEKAYRDVLKEVGIADKRHDAILRIADLDKLELADGKIKDADTLKTSLKTEWADFITTTKTEGSKVETPPNTTQTTDKEAEVIAKVRTAMGLPAEQKGS